MLENKNIDRLFQEKFKDMEVTPGPEIWENIEAKLQKKKRRIFPIWWLSSGVAAMLIFGLLLFPEIKKIEDNNQKDNLNLPQKIEEVVNTKKLKNKDVIEKETNQEIVSIEKKREITKRKKKQIGASKKKIKTKQILAFGDKKTEKNIEKGRESEETVKGISSDKKIVMEKIFSNKEEKDQSNKKKEKGRKDFIAELKKEKENVKVVSKENKWSVSPVLGVLKSNSFTNASAIDAGLNSNKTSGENTFSYGVNVAYKINKKWSVQSGIHMQKVEFNTKNVAIVSSVIGSSNLTNINSNQEYFIVNSFENADALSLSNSFAVEQGSLNQTYGYIEIPIEMKYNILSSSKIRTNIIAGFSSLFLNQNTITAETSSFSEVLGEANNLNTINFSGNFGLDVDYSINNKMKFNINPMFKSHFNTFSKNSNGFKPYTFGIYTGIKYEF
ncbi:outer membrane protein with beta-barrel domain [Tenacibaculum adriaticum]|uniref:Outer membrane protein with beta-barrel domain n=1 Tax=Tenacibaculum adriaticum TaxID=413713 RepID=A0A5S5DV59_9FLAO|nr:outer membrane beta-barrel protein [Tenacibaculum adriaticum]TYP99823.1 outer membrane protein with beta-barrel domain [Tenacibaculum adriaticum]